MSVFLNCGCLGLVTALRERIDRAAHYGLMRAGQHFTDALQRAGRGPQMVVVRTVASAWARARPRSTATKQGHPQFTHNSNTPKHSR
jgi:hypothetical protein